MGGAGVAKSPQYTLTRSYALRPVTLSQVSKTEEGWLVAASALVDHSTSSFAASPWRSLRSRMSDVFMGPIV